MRLETLVAQRKAAQLSLAGIYEPPPRDMADAYVTQLVQERPVIHLVEGARSFSGDARGAAVGLDDGQIVVFSSQPCGRLALPEDLPVVEIAWPATSPVLAALAKDRKRLRVLDLRQCGLILDESLKGSISHIAVSADGDYVSATDEALELRIGPAQGPLQTAGRLRFAPLALFFSPGGKLLLVADSGGWITVWDPQKADRVGQMRVEDGPFVSASHQGQYLALTREDGATRYFNVASRSPVASNRAKDIERLFQKAEGGDFSLRDGVLRYRLKETELVRKLLLGGNQLQAYVSANGETLLVKDMDGRQRRYDTATGDLLEGKRGSGWRSVPITAGRARTPRGEAVLADCAVERDGLMLMSRSVPGAGHFVWWRPYDEAVQCPEIPRGLPGRPNVSPDAQVNWMEPFGSVATEESISQ